jgi:hypothetical protein
MHDPGKTVYTGTDFLTSTRRDTEVGFPVSRNVFINVWATTDDGQRYSNRSRPTDPFGNLVSQESCVPPTVLVGGPPPPPSSPPPH